jgi:hypothetical protein
MRKKTIKKTKKHEQKNKNSENGINKHYIVLETNSCRN